MGNNPNSNLIRSLIFVGLVLTCLCWIFFSRQHREKALRAHPAWAIAYFDGVVKGNKGAQYAGYRFQVGATTYHTGVNIDDIRPLGAKVWTTCFPILYASRDTDNNIVIMNQDDLYRLGMQLPDSVERAVKQANHPFELAAHPYPYATGLKRDYDLRYDFDDYTEFLTLRDPHGDTIKKALVTAERGTRFRSLGYVIADFPDHFVLAHAYDSTQPPHIQLFEKHTGANLLEPGAVLVGVDEDHDELVYRIPGDHQRIILCSADTSRKRSYACPKNADENSLKLAGITDAAILLTYQDTKGTTQKIIIPSANSSPDSP